MPAQFDQHRIDFVRGRADRLSVDVQVVSHGAKVRWWAVSRFACRSMASKQRVIDRYGDSTSVDAAWASVENALNSVYGKPG
jgi:hypothetical protein